MEVKKLLKYIRLIAVYFTDYHMPDMDSVPTMKKIRKFEKENGIIIT